MNPSDRYLEGLASETGFRKETLEKVLRLGEILSDVSSHPLLSNALALKGGTALNLCFGEPTRLSVDLDFNYVRAEERSRMLEERPAVERAILQIAKGRGYQTQQSRDEHAGRKYFLTYRSAGGTRDHVEIDLNFLQRIPLLPMLEKPLWQPGRQPWPTARVVSLEELCSGKLCALLDRAIPRDLYDVSRLPRVAGSLLSNLRFRRLFIAMAGTLDHALYDYGRKRLERVTADDVRRQLYPMLSGTDRPDAARLRQEAWNVVAPFLDLERSGTRIYGEAPARRACSRASFSG